jgi:hypothetical protein
MAHSMVIEGDADDFNARILAKIARSRLTRYEGSHLPFEIVLRSPEVKCLFAESFNSFQGNLFMMLAKARNQCPHEVVAEVAKTIRKHIVKCTDRAERKITVAQKLFEDNGMVRLVDDADKPIAVTAKVISSHGLRYLQLLLKADQLMAMLDALAAANLVSGNQSDLRKKRFNRSVREIAGKVLTWQMELKVAHTAQDYARWPSGLHRTDAAACPMPVKEGLDGCASLFSDEDAACECGQANPDADSPCVPRQWYGGAGVPSAVCSKASP